MSVAIKFEGVSKKFKMQQERARSFQEAFVNGLKFRRKKTDKDELWILKNVSFSIAHGESVALIGANGAGKSTMLKLISRILFPTGGEIVVDGRVSSLLELGTGFHPDLSGRENIYLNASMLGLSRKETDAKYSDILAFSEMADFIDMPVRHYSSGMYLRLAFAIAIHVEPDILLVDEAMAVGDHAFQQKCLKRISDLHAAGVTFILVSHDMDTARRHCKRGIWLHNGAIQMDGDIERASEAYLAVLYEEYYRRQTGTPGKTSATSNTSNANRWGNGEIEIYKVEILNTTNEIQTVFMVGEPLTVRIHYRAKNPVEKPLFGIAIHRSDGVHINGPNTKQAGYRLGTVVGVGYIDYTISALNLLPGGYEISTAVYDAKGNQAYDHHHRLYRIQILSGSVKERYGILYLPSSWQHYAKTD